MRVALFFPLFISTLICFFLPAFGTAQTVEDDFEGNGTINNWVGDQCTINSGFSNPFIQGINLSSKVLEYKDNGGQYANVRFEIPNNFNLVDNHIFTLKIYVPSNGLTGSQNNQVSLKLQDGSIGSPWSTQSEIIKPVNSDQWQTLSFNFKSDRFKNADGNSSAPSKRSDFNRVVIQVNGENNTDQVLAYLDDFYYSDTNTTTPVSYQLIWFDEFNRIGNIDGSKWFHQTQLPVSGSWFNGEVQHYTNRNDNSYVANGMLKIVAKKESFTDQGQAKNYTSARLNSKFAFTYGKVEIRAKLPTGVGTWPAMWMLGKNINEDGAYWDNLGFGTKNWPACGEIDIMEHWGSNQNHVQSAMHTPSSFGSTMNLGGQNIPTASTDFHIYTMEWTFEKMEFSVDGKRHYTYQPPVKDKNTWPFDEDQYLLLNIAIQSSIDFNFTQSAMEIDYVRVYQEKPTLTSNTVDNASALKFYPNPFRHELTIKLKESSLGETQIDIYNIHGKMVRSFKSTSEDKTLIISDLSDLTQGIYLVSFKINHKPYLLKVYKN